MSNRLQQLSVFVRAAETGSFSRTARELGLSQPSVSRIVHELEARLDVTLLLRSTRKVTPTEAGMALLERARLALRELESAEDAARGIDSLRGTVRVATPVAFGRREVVPRLAPFLAAHPQLRLELIMSDDRHDLIAEGADVAIRFGPLQDSGFGARLLTTLTRSLVASPAYFAQRPLPRTPSDLVGHDLIFGPGIMGRSHWSFQKEGRVVSVEVEGRIQVNNGEGLIGCVLAGLGIAMASDSMIRGDMKEDAILYLLQDFELAPIPVYAVFPAGPHPSQKVRALVDHLAGTLHSPAAVALEPA